MSKFKTMDGNEAAAAWSPMHLLKLPQFILSRRLHLWLNTSMIGAAGQKNLFGNTVKSY